MSEVLLKVYLGKKTENLIAQADKISPNLARKIRDLGRKAIKDVADMALNAYKSKVPIDTGEFREDFLKRDIKSTSFTIYVASGDHLGRDKKPVLATELSRILDVGIHPKTGKEMKRSQNSAPISSSYGYSYGLVRKNEETRDWQGKSFRAFKNALPKYLSTLRLY